MGTLSRPAMGAVRWVYIHHTPSTWGTKVVPHSMCHAMGSVRWVYPHHAHGVHTQGARWDVSLPTASSGHNPGPGFATGLLWVVRCDTVQHTECVRCGTVGARYKMLFSQVPVSAVLRLGCSLWVSLCSKGDITILPAGGAGAPDVPG